VFDVSQRKGLFFLVSPLKMSEYLINYSSGFFGCELLLKDFAADGKQNGKLLILMSRDSDFNTIGDSMRLFANTINHIFEILIGFLCNLIGSHEFRVKLGIIRRHRALFEEIRAYGSSRVEIQESDVVKTALLEMLITLEFTFEEDLNKQTFGD
jgi:hypothetical protein